MKKVLIFMLTIAMAVTFIPFFSFAEIAEDEAIGAENPVETEETAEAEDPIEDETTGEAEEAAKTARPIVPEYDIVLNDISIGNIDINDVRDEEAKPQLNGESVLPKYYDSRDDLEPTRVKDQKNSGLCWAFAISTASEYSAKKQGLEYVEESPGHFGYFFYNRAGDPLGKTNHDFNIITSSKYNWTTIGGDRVLSAQALANWGGMATEDDAPTVGMEYNPPEMGNYSKSQAFEENIILKNSRLIDGKDSDAVKRSIMKYGSVVIAYHAPVKKDGEYDVQYEDGSVNHYYSGDPSSNHEVVVVGWDDNYSREKFAIPDLTPTPSEDGAWIIQNSWGKAFEDYYISYEDTSFAYAGKDGDGNVEYLALALEMQDANKYKYNYQYDGTAGLNSIHIPAGEKIANVFSTGDRNIELDAVGFTALNYGRTDYRIRVYTGLKSGTDPESGVRKCSFTVHTDDPGCYTFEIPEKTRVFPEKGTKYSIVIEALNKDTGTYFGGETTYNVGKQLKFQAYTQSGQSFVGEGSDWDDFKSVNYCARIKGFANDHAHKWTVTKTEAGLLKDGKQISKCDTCGKTVTKVIARGWANSYVKDFRAVKGKKSFTAKWAKRSTAVQKKFNGYQIRYSLKKSMSGATTKAVKKSSSGKTISKLKGGKTYYVQVRTYTKKNGTTFYSKWSAKKAVKTRR